MARTQTQTHRWTIRTLVLVLAFLGSINLALFLSGRTFSIDLLWSTVQQVVFNEVEEQTAELSAPDLGVEDAETAGYIPTSQQTFEASSSLHHQGESHQFSCIDLSAGAITREPDTAIYKWVDANGQVHFADREPDSAMLAEIIGLGGVREQYFDLDINALSGQVPEGFRADIELRANKAYEVLAGMVSELQRNKVALNVMLVEGRAEYETYASSLGFNGASNADGFYRMSNNQAVVLQSADSNRTLAIATHEAVHVINAGLYGVIPRWLNEGLAEYLETMNLHGQVAEVPWRSTWSGQPNSYMSVNGLVGATQENWDGPNRGRLYASSRAFVYFLMSTERGKQWLSDFLTLKSSRVCDPIREEPFFNIHFGSISGAQSEFQSWLGGTILPVHLH